MTNDPARADGALPSATQSRNSKTIQSNSEPALLSQLRLRATSLGGRLFRNNVGALQDKRGVWVKYGLCPGSSDLIGWTPVTITADMVGRTLAVFTAVEAKTGRVPVTVEQRRFLDAVTQAGGVGIVARSAEDLDASAGGL